MDMASGHGHGHYNGHRDGYNFFFVTVRTKTNRNSKCFGSALSFCETKNIRFVSVFRNRL
jgi:hypothetical protein